MDGLIKECDDFIGDSFPYAICGGHALELFAGKTIRPHSDVDISIFDEGRRSAAEFILERGWNIYEHVPEAGGLRLITDPHDKGVTDGVSLWTIKPGSSVVEVSPAGFKDGIFNYEIVAAEQKHFDFIEIIFNSKNDTHFICDKDKGVSRELDKAILFADDVPYLAPELVLFFKSHPAYSENAYHKGKTPLDFNAVAPLLPRESKEWLMTSLEATYPDGHPWLDRLR